MSKIVDELILVFSRVSLSKFSLEGLSLLFTFHRYKGIYSSIRKECERSFFCIIGHSGNLVSRVG